MTATLVVRIAVTSVAIGLVSAGLAVAQPEVPQGRIPGWSFTPSLGASVVYDTNVTLADVRGETVTDTVFLISPSGQISFVGPRTDFDAGYGGHLWRYADLDQLNGFNQRLYASLRRLASKRVTIEVRNIFNDVPTTDDVELNGVPYSRAGARTNGLTAGVEARLTKLTSLDVNYELTWVAFDRESTFLTGGWVNGVGAGLRRALNERLSVGGEYSLRLANLNQNTEELTFQNVGGTVQYRLARHTTLAAGAGLAHLTDHTDNETRNGPYVRVTLSHLLPRATIGAGFSRAFVPTFGFGGSSSNQEIRGFITMPFTENRTYVQGSVLWRRTDPFEATALELDAFRLEATVGYALSRWLRMEGVYTYTAQDSRADGGEISRHRVGTQIVIAQPMRIR